MPEKTTQQQIPQDQLDIARQDLDELRALRVSYQDLPLLGTKELTRFWPDISPEHEKICVRYLNAYTSAKNTGDPQFYVEDPLANKEVCPGIWRNAGAQMSKQASGLKGVIQVLRFGFAAQLNWDEARLDQDDYDHATLLPYGIKNIRWVGIDPQKLQAISRGLNQPTYTNFTIQGETYAETWYNIKVLTKLADDGSGILILTLALQDFTFMAYTMGWDQQASKIIYEYVPKNRVQGILNLYGTTLADYHTDVDVSYNESSELSTITVTVTSLTDQESHDYADNCLETVAVVKHTAAAAELPSPTAPVNSKIEVYNEPTATGKVKTTQRTTTAKPHDPTTDSMDSAAESVVATEKYNQATEEPAAVDADGKIVEVNNKLTEYCGFDTTKKERTVKDQTITSHEVDASGTKTDVLHTAGPEIAAPAAVTGSKIIVQQEPTEFQGKKRTHLITDTPNDLPGSGSQDGPAESVSVLDHDNADAALPAANGPAVTLGPALVGAVGIPGGSGYIERVANQQNDVGKWKTHYEITEGKYRYCEETFADRYGNSFVATGTNANQTQYATALARAGFTSATSNGISKRVNDFGLIDFSFTKSCYDGTTQIWEWGLKTNHLRFDLVWRQDITDAWYYRHAYYRIRQWIETSYSFAQAHCDGGTHGAGINTGVDRWGNSQFIATLVEFDHFGAWVADSGPP